VATGICVVRQPSQTGVLSGICRVHRAQPLQLSGEWRDAVREAQVAVRTHDEATARPSPRWLSISSVMVSARSSVCGAFADALRRYGVPEEVPTDNGKQVIARFGLGGEVLFDRICRDNGIAHRLTQPASRTTTGKVERFHLTLRRELLDLHEPFESLAAAQQAVADSRLSSASTAPLRNRVDRDGWRGAPTGRHSRRVSVGPR
jgi:hypothetical protein